MKSFVMILLLFIGSIGFSLHAYAEHPKGLINAESLAEVRTRITAAPYNGWYQQLWQSKLRMEEEVVSVVDLSFLIRLEAFLFALNEKGALAQSCYERIMVVADDSLFVNAPYSFGLSRAAILRNLAMAYDFCFVSWDETQRKNVAGVIFRLMKSVNANMGPHANYTLESNWMGVRYGSVLFAAVVLDDALIVQMGHHQELLSHIWDAKERLRDHIEASYTPGGWFVESMGYHIYDGQFVWPAIIAFQNSLPQGVLDFEIYAPRLLKSHKQHITGTLSIPSVKGVGLKPDLADDHPMVSFTHWPLWLSIMPESEHPEIRWMHQYIAEGGTFTVPDDFFYSILYYDANLSSVNPATEDYFNYVDETQGVVMFRNAFKDATDILTTFNVSSNRYRGHSGPDNLTFRLMGLGNIWTLGAGRTADPKGQTNLFPSADTMPAKAPWAEGQLTGYDFRSDGSGYAIGSGSCLDVVNHQRFIGVDYSAESNASAVLVIKDVSDNGRLWRLHTPGFNHIEVLSDGVLIVGPNGSSLKLSLPQIQEPIIRLGSIRYGGETIRNNPGVGFHGEYYLDNTIIDIECEGDIMVVMTLQEAQKKHPTISFDAERSEVKVGAVRMMVSDLRQNE